MNDFPFKKQINSVRDLELIIKNVREFRGLSAISEVFRGQGCNCWKLIPRIARVIKDPEKIKILEFKIIYDFLEMLEIKD